MKIGLEAERANLPNPTGVEHYAAELIRHLAKIDHENEYILYFRTKPQQWFYDLPSNYKLRVIPFPKFWTQIRLSWEMYWHPVDVLMILASALPIYHPKKSVFTAHDVAYEFFPQAFTPFMLRYLIWSTRHAVKAAAKIIAVSKSTRDDIVRVYQTQASKVEVVYLGLDEYFKPKSYEQSQSILDKHDLTYKKYLLFVGTLQPRKNLPKLIDAFIKLKKEHRIEEKLAIAGGKGWLYQPILDKIRLAGMNSEIKFLNYVDAEDLPALYSGAVLTTLPALYEGFGLPPLEAMACGTPVVVSNVSSMPEVVGDAGRLVDPNSVDSIAEGLLEVVSSKELQEQMSKRGIIQAGKFTWENTARQTLELLKSLK